MVRSGTILNSSRVTHRARIGDQLQKLIVEHHSGAGGRLPTVAALAKRFNVSVGTLHLALTDLEARGLIHKKRGAGMFVASAYAPVTMRDTVAVCMESGTHLYGELWEQLMAALHERHLLPLGIDTVRTQGAGLLDRLPMDQLGCYMIHADPETILRLVDRTEAQGTPVIAFLVAPDLPDSRHYHRIVCDLEDMAGLMLKHLRTAGYRRLVFLGPGTDEMALANPGLLPSVVAVMARKWGRQGEDWSFLRSAVDQPTPSKIAFDEDRLLALVRETPGPAAIVGGRDVEAWEAQQVLRRRAPELADRLRFFGFNDTPWSRAGSPPFTTVSVNIPAMVSAAMRILDAARAGNEIGERIVTIRPELVVRENR